MNIYDFIRDSVARRKSCRGRIPGLDGLRAISIALVVYDHIFRIGGGVETAWTRWVCPFTGTTGVCIFFILSGYLITSILLNEQERCGNVRLWAFYARRTLRIFPPFYMYLIVVGSLAILSHVHINSKAFLSSALYVYNLQNQSDHLVDNTWSLSVEEQFYLCWPAVVFALHRHLVGLAGVGILFWPVLRYFRHGFLAYPEVETAINAASLDTILCGSLLAILARREGSRQSMQTLANLPGLLPITLLAIYGLYAGKNYLPEIIFVVLPTIRNILITLALWLVVAGPPRARGALESWPVVYIGMISYSLYLWQQPFWYTTIFRLPKEVAVVCAVLLAALSYHVIECNCEKLKERWSITTKVSGGS